MSKIKQTTGVISNIRDLSPTAREYTITPSEPLDFVAGAFVNVFVEHEGQMIRRAFSFSSDDQNQDSFTLSIRHSPNGLLTTILWSRDFTGENVKLMGPLGLNTADKMTSRKIFLFGFGVGAGVVKSIAEHMLRRSDIEDIIIMTGNRSIEEILHKDYFDEISNDKRTQVGYVVADESQNIYPTGYIQNHIENYDFNNADVYMCGQGVACTALREVIEAKQPENCRLFIEDFH